MFAPPVLVALAASLLGLTVVLLRRRVPWLDFAHSHAGTFSASFVKHLRPRSYAQRDQDRWLVAFLRGRRGGYFVDLGASNGVISNNTFLLERAYGWRGLCIEPNPFFFRQLVRHRRCTCVQTCIDRQAGTVDFVFRGATGGIVGADTDNRHANGAAPVATRSLLDVLESHGAPPVIDYLSLDAEGAETRILLGFDFDRFRFLVMTIERPTPVLHDHLLAHGYVLICHDGVDGYYRHSSQPAPP